MDLGVTLGLLMVLAGCATTAPPSTGGGARSPGDLVFLTRAGCVNTDTMLARLNVALQAEGLSANYQVIDADTLPAGDPRGGYGTPTVLVAGRDLFGMPEPTAPLSAPT